MLKRKKSSTCIAVCRNKSGRLMMAGDRRASWDYSKAQVTARPKISKRSGMLLGATGDGFLCSLFVDVMDIPKYKDSQDLDKYMFNDFYNAIYNELVNHGLAEEHNLLKIPSDMSCELIVGFKNKVFIASIENSETEKEFPNGTIAIDEVSVPYAAGCGDSAEKVLHYILATKGYITKDDLKKAVEVIGESSPGCDSNVDVLVSD